MDLRRLRAGEWMAGLAGVALLVALFLPWYGEPDQSGWEALAVNDVLLAAAALFGIVTFLATATQPVPAVPIFLDALLALAGMIATLLVLIRVAFLPDGADSREWGLLLGLVGALGIAVGGWVSMRDQRLSPPGRPTDLTGRPVAEPEEVEVLPPPDPTGAASR
jgi:heme A synthase